MTSANEENLTADKLVSTDDPRNAHEGDCGDRHPSHHSCHVGHCAFTACSSFDFQIPHDSASLRTLYNSSLLAVTLPGPRKPPRA